MSDSSVTFDPMSAGSNPISRLLAWRFPTFFMRSRLVKVLVLLNQTSDQNLIQVLVTPESFSSGSPAGSPTITPRSALHGLKSDLIISDGAIHQSLILHDVRTGCEEPKEDPPVVPVLPQSVLD